MSTQNNTEQPSIIIAARPDSTSNSDDPYQAPAESDSADIPSPVIEGKIYSSFSIALATLFGSVLAMGLLIYANFEHFGQKIRGFLTIIITILLTIMVLFISLFISGSRSMLYFSINLVATFVAFAIVQITQGRIILGHEQRNGQFHSMSRAILIGLLCMAGLWLFLKSAIYLYFNFARHL